MADLLNIIINPNPILRKKSKEISEKKISSQEMQKLCLDMIRTMIEKDGIGLAAPQIGKNIRLIAINQKGGPICLFNPKITKKSWLREWGEEGCLSVPETFGQVQRYKKIVCTYQDQNNILRQIKAQGLSARVIQHETDHLDGILFIDKAKKIKEQLNTKENRQRS